MSEMIATEGVISHEGKYGRRVDGDFYPVYGKYGEVVDYKYNHKKCWFCGSNEIMIKENDNKVCTKCNTVINGSFVVRLKKAVDEAESKRRKDARMRSYKYYVMQNIPKESWQHP